VAAALPLYCSNGEINTAGNLNWLKTSEQGFTSPLFTKEEMEILVLIVSNDQSDSACLDNMIELLTMTAAAFRM
jgi:glutamate synthase (NADPH/NADH) large chain